MGRASGGGGPSTQGGGRGGGQGGRKGREGGDSSLQDYTSFVVKKAGFYVALRNTSRNFRLDLKSCFSAQSWVPKAWFYVHGAKIQDNRSIPSKTFLSLNHHQTSLKNAGREEGGKGRECEGCGREIIQFTVTKPLFSPYLTQFTVTKPLFSPVSLKQDYTFMKQPLAHKTKNPW